MGAGKSTVGRLLAERIGWEFVDLDGLVERTTGRTPGEIIREDGVAGFRAVEAALMAEQERRRRVVIAPGGGWALQRERAEDPPGTLRVWLRVTAAEAVRRAEADAVDRPLLGPPEGRVERAQALLDSREPRYAEAEIVVDVDGRDPRSVVDEIVRRGMGEAGAR